MNLPDRILCFLLGHTWEGQPPYGKGVYACPHCTSRWARFTAPPKRHW